MSEPKWLSREDVEDIHNIILEIGSGRPGVRDAAMLESALARPQNPYAYEDPTIFDLAALAQAFTKAEDAGQVAGLLNEKASDLVLGGWDDGVVANVQNFDILAIK